MAWYNVTSEDSDPERALLLSVTVSRPVLHRGRDRDRGLVSVGVRVAAAYLVRLMESLALFGFDRDEVRMAACTVHCWSILDGISAAPIFSLTFAEPPSGRARGHAAAQPLSRTSSHCS